MANSTENPYFAEPGVSSCVDAQTFLGSSNEYENGKLNADVGGAFITVSSKSDA
jgi:hypothetical protein